MDAYILIHTDVGRAGEVARVVETIRGVRSVVTVTGPYDLVVRAEADNQRDLDSLILSRIQAVPGVSRTLTCPIWRREPLRVPETAGAFWP